MEYIFILILQTLGIGFNVAQKIRELDGKFPEKSIAEIRNLYLDNEWASLGTSALVLIVHLVTHAIVDIYFAEFREFNIPIPFIEGHYIPYLAASFALAFILGYCGQAVFYKWLGKSKDYLTKKAE